MTPPAVSVQAARRFILGCQGLWPGRRSAGRPGARKALHQSGLAQIDPLNVVGRSHDIALHARAWDYRPEHLDHVLYTSREFFDYGGTLYVLPMGELPYWRVHMARRAAEEKPRAFAAEHEQLLDYVWEVYKPAAERRWGYYVMPILYGDRLVGRADLRIDRASRTLIVPHLWLEPSASGRDADLVRAIGRGLRRLAEWAGGDDVHIEATSPARLRAPLARAIRD